MASNLLQKVLVSTTVGTVVGFSTIFGAANSAKAVNLPDTDTTVEVTTEVSTSETVGAELNIGLSSQTNSSTEPVSVPEPGSIAAIAIFGLGGLLGKRKISS